MASDISLRVTLPASPTGQERGDSVCDHFSASRVQVSELNKFPPTNSTYASRYERLQSCRSTCFGGPSGGCAAVSTCFLASAAIPNCGHSPPFEVLFWIWKLHVSACVGHRGLARGLPYAGLYVGLKRHAKGLVAVVI